MPAVDQCHPQVVRTLEKAGWHVERHQVLIQIKKRRGYIDLRASRGENGTQHHILLVEVKCFANPDEQTSDLYMAVGLYLVYRSMLNELHNPTSLYLCLPHRAYQKLFDRPIQRVITESQIKLVIVNLEHEEIVQWME